MDKSQNIEGMKYEPINGWTKESIINHIKANFKEKSVSESGISCLYRSLNGNKCAIGLFIPDEHYYPEMEGGSLANIMTDLKIRSCMPLETRALTLLQRVHDQETHSDFRSNSRILEDLLLWIEENVEDSK